jgi:hypothetical protein
MAIYDELPKRLRKILRELAGKAFDREVERDLNELATAIDRWRSGEMEAPDLNEAIENHVREAKRRRSSTLYFSNSMLHFGVTQALVRGLLKPEEVPAELQAALEGAIEYCRPGTAEGTVRSDEED